MVERVLILEAGETATLLLVAERVMGEIQVKHHVAIPRSLGPTNEIVPETIEQLKLEYDPIRIIVITPQSDTVSQRIELTDQRIEDFVARESARFQAVDGSLPIVDHHPIPKQPKESYWLTYCQPDVITNRLDKLGLGLADVDDVTCAAQGFLGLYLQHSENKNTCYVVDVGHGHSSLMCLDSGQPVFATSFTFNFPKNSLPPDRETVDRWLQRLQTSPSSIHGLPNQSLEIHDDCQFILSGDPSLVGPIKQVLEASFPGSILAPADDDQENRATTEFGVAVGVATLSLTRGQKGISLLPPEHRRRRDSQTTWNRLRGWATILSLVCIVLLLVVSIQKLTLFRFKQSLLSDTRAAIRRMEETEKTLQDFSIRYELVRPILRFQQETTELLETMEALHEQARDPAYWLVLLADNATYTTKEITLGTTNSPAPTLLSPATSQLRTKPGFVAEFSFNVDGETRRTKLLKLVENLQATGLYAKVDTLAEDIRRPLADTNVVINNQHVALSIELKRNYFRKRLSLESPPLTSALSESTPAVSNSSFGRRNEQIERTEIEADGRE